MSALYGVDVRHLDGEVHVVLRGELDLAAVPVLRDACAPLVYRYDGDQIVLDCTGVELLDMATVGVLVGLCNRVGPTGRPRLLGPSPQLRRVLELAGVAERFRVVDADRPAVRA